MRSKRHKPIPDYAFSLPPPKSNNSKGLKGFTLAEVLITLAIIGVVAALTIPTLMKNYERAQLQAQFKRAYKFLSQGIERTYADNGNELVPSSVVNSDNANQNGQNALAYIADTYWGGRTNATITKSTTSFNQYNGPANPSVLGCRTDKFTLKNGMQIFSRYGCSRYPIEVAPNIYLTAIIVDVNGDKGPNRWGYDIWSFNIDYKNHQLVIDGVPHYYEHGHGHNVPFKCGSQGKAKFDEDYGCGYYAIIDKCPDDESKGYWECLKL